MTFEQWWATGQNRFSVRKQDARGIWDDAIIAERERCAKLVEDYDGDEGLVALAERIRKGGGK